MKIGTRCLGKTVEDFFVLLEEYPDRSENLVVFRNFLKLFLRSKMFSEIVIAAKILTVLKHEKPFIFSLLKKQANADIVLSLLIELEMDIKEARQRLHDILRHTRFLQAGQESLSRGHIYTSRTYI